MLSGGFFVKQERGFFINHQNIKLFIYIFCIFILHLWFLVRFCFDWP